ncbi:helix-turn-helix domain-containing protein [Novosphingobium olei]|uniref:helix-turn-helix domain-containing protein n=1 Tax=Novosphingobium olei TaxID=2728851 RepID=UPI00308E9550|nr:helix-turn-helix domain-containing protein [Novosphingobium olei]
MGCATCGKDLSRANVSGYCQSHVWQATRALPDFKERIRTGIKRKIATDPIYKDGLRKRAIALGQDPVINEKRTRHFVEGRIWEIGAKAAATPEARAKAGRSISDTKLAWCPQHLREQYRFLIRNHYGRDEARRLILEQDAKERQRLRIRMGAEQPQRIPSSEPFGPPCTAELKLVMNAARTFHVPVEEILSPSRERPVVRARQALMLALKKHGVPMREIGRYVGSRDRTTVIYGLRQAESLLLQDESFADRLRSIAA